MKAAPTRAVGAVPIVLVGVASWIFFPANRILVVELTVAALLAVGLIKMARDAGSLRPRGGSFFARDFDQSGRAAQRPDDLIRVERIVGWRSYDALDFDRRVRPFLRQMLSYRLRAGYGIDPDHDPEAARAVLPPQLAQLVEGSSNPDPFAGVRVDARLVSALLSQIEEL